MTIRVAAAILLLPLLGGGLAEANRAYRTGDPKRAADVYAERLARGDSSATVRYNLGTALLRLGRHDEARAQLEAAADARGEVPAALRVRAHYNAGNADLEPVFAKRVPDDQRSQRLRRAIARYRRALLADSRDFDAKWNLELAQRLLDREQPKSSGGGGSDDPQQGGGGGEGDDRPSPAGPQPQPSPASQGGGSPQITPQQAERILSRAERQERDLQRRSLERNRGRVVEHTERDW